MVGVELGVAEDQLALSVVLGDEVVALIVLVDVAYALVTRDLGRAPDEIVVPLRGVAERVAQADHPRAAIVGIASDVAERIDVRLAQLPGAQLRVIGASISIDPSELVASRVVVPAARACAGVSLTQDPTEAIEVSLELGCLVPRAGWAQPEELSGERAQLCREVEGQVRHPEHRRGLRPEAAGKTPLERVGR